MGDETKVCGKCGQPDPAHLPMCPAAPDAMEHNLGQAV